MGRFIPVLSSSEGQVEQAVCSEMGERPRARN